MFFFIFYIFLFLLSLHKQTPKSVPDKAASSQFFFSGVKLISHQLLLLNVYVIYPSEDSFQI